MMLKNGLSGYLNGLEIGLAIYIRQEKTGALSLHIYGRAQHPVQTLPAGVKFRCCAHFFSVAEEQEEWAYR